MLIRNRKRILFKFARNCLTETRLKGRVSLITSLLMMRYSVTTTSQISYGLFPTGSHPTIPFADRISLS